MTAGDQRWGAQARSIIVLAGPIAVSQLAQMAMAVTDAIMLGGIGPRALAAGGLGAATFFTVQLAFQAIVGATAILVARANGAGRPELVPPIFWTAVALAGALVAPDFLVIGFSTRLLRDSGVDPALASDVATYLDVLRWGVPAALLGLGLMRAFLPAIGQQRTLMLVTLAAAVGNAALNRVFIHGAFSWHGWGLRGSAAATAATLWLAVLALAFLLGRRAPDRVRRHAPRARMMREMLALGLPIGLTTIIETALFLAAGILAGGIGADALAAHQIALNVGSVTFMVPLAVSQAAAVRVGEAAGAGDRAGARRAGLASLALAAAFMAAAALTLLTLPRAIVAAYVDPHDPAGANTTALAVSLLAVAAAFQVADGVQVAALGALRGLKDTRVPLLIAAIGYWGIGFGLGHSLAFRFDYGLRGLWLGLFAGLASVAAGLTLRFLLLTRRRAAAMIPAAVTTS